MNTRLRSSLIGGATGSPEMLALRVRQAFMSRRRLIQVWIDDGYVVCAQPDCKAAMHAEPGSIIGVYTVTAKAADIADDIRAVQGVTA